MLPKLYGEEAVRGDVGEGEGLDFIGVGFLSWGNIARTDRAERS